LLAALCELTTILVLRSRADGRKQGHPPVPLQAIRIPGASFGETAMSRQILWCAVGILILLTHAVAIARIDGMRQAADPASEPICFSGD
jgi:hypothetical protein